MQGIDIAGILFQKFKQNALGIAQPTGPVGLDRLGKGLAGPL